MTVIAGTVAALICAVLITMIVIGVRGRVTEYRRNQALSEALRVVEDLRRGPVRGVLSAPRGVALQVLDPRNTVIAGTPGEVNDPPIATFRPGAATGFKDAQVICPPTGTEGGCRWVIDFTVRQPAGEWQVYAAAPNVPWYVSGGLLTFLVSVGLIVVLLVALRTWRTVDRTLAPVDEIRRELTEITASKSGRRVTVPENRDEIRRLAEAVNATLDRLDAALAKQRGFTSDASHDLRSPIAAARTQLEEALLYADDIDWPRTARTVLQTLDRLQAIVTDLLQLARLDAGAWQDTETVDLAAMVTIELARSDRSKRIVTQLQEGVQLRGDRLRLVRLFTNLLDNAERHAESQVQVTVRDEDGTAVLEVLDDGAGIAPEEREVVFQRFARLKAGKARDANGTGLGLPIAREIAKAHGGTLKVEDSDRGARFVLRIPRES
ncbi:sensor histidine kinase [Actinomadura verrucosospora]|uniref:histidine kinase n=1 Tax=Actinomadura verrucosospora TaxID=46165 RepID=A0A7D3VYP6_ACTVE|nr:HAMP domain-containing sensor histidine kinase [Actinomadura verrucosospora]QKG24294.1 signal transduction histidine kinase-like protein [Actinomadura verrucosospora]